MAVKRLKRQADIVGRVYEALHHKAVHFELRPGEHVNELQLAGELEVSRTPVREALNRLVSDGLMTFVPNKGFFRVPIDIGAVRSLFEVRSGLESMALRLACARASDAAIDEIEAYWRGIKAISRKLTIAEIVQHDEAFHERLVALADNPELTRLVKETNARIRFMRLVAMEFRNYRQITFEDHLAIVESLRKRDVAGALARLERHIAITLDDIERITKETIARIYLKKPAEVVA
jgi:DNA-binding GntR family transcriptional regulator